MRTAAIFLTLATVTSARAIARRDVFSLEVPTSCAGRCEGWGDDCLIGKGMSASCNNFCLREDQLRDCYTCILEVEGDLPPFALPSFCDALAPPPTCGNTVKPEDLQVPSTCEDTCERFELYRRDCLGTALGHGCMAHCGQEEAINACYDCVADATNINVEKLDGPVNPTCRR